ncbi:hypothetical protein D3C81_1575850 [compost metagenome]
MTWMEIHVNLMVDYFKAIKVLGGAELVLPFTIDIIHKDILIRLIEFKDTGSFHSIIGLLFITRLFNPFPRSQ